MKPYLALAALATICALPPAALAAESVATPNFSTVKNPASWLLSHATGESMKVDGHSAIRLVAAGDSASGKIGLARPTGLEFSTGTIELMLKGQNKKQASFLGVAFNVVDDRTFEAVYFRPFNFKGEGPARSRAVQYIAWPDHTWEKLRKASPGKFENAVQPVPDPEQWFHARIEVTDREVRVFVDHAAAPSLTVTRLTSGQAKRPVALFVDVADGLYANLSVKP